MSASDESEVRGAMASFLDALNSLDVARMDAAFTDDVTASFRSRRRMKRSVAPRSREFFAGSSIGRGRQLRV
jgi:ketosteroid isomerase-like protein